MGPEGDSQLCLQHSPCWAPAGGRQGPGSEDDWARPPHLGKDDGASHSGRREASPKHGVGPGGLCGPGDVLLHSFTSQMLGSSLLELPSPRAQPEARYPQRHEDSEGVAPDPSLHLD